jgi:hypothetical protein
MSALYRSNRSAVSDNIVHEIFHAKFVIDAAAISEAETAPGFKPVIVWEHTTSDDDDGMVYQWRKKE